MHRLILIEDDPIVQQALKSVLTSEGFEVIIAGSGEAGLKAVAEQKPDLAILDIHLPDMTGFEVCRRLKGDASTRRMPVLILSGEARETPDRIQGIEVGAEDYLLKPASPQILVARVKTLLRVCARPR